MRIGLSNWTPLEFVAAFATVALLLIINYYRGKKAKETKVPVSKTNIQEALNDEDENELFEKTIVKLITDNKQFNISLVENLDNIVSMKFTKEKYPIISSLIKSKNWEELKAYNVFYDSADEFLEVYTFIDQDKNNFAVTIYDSLELTEYPQIIDIFPLI